MKRESFKDAKMRGATLRKRAAVLKCDELQQPKFPGRQSLEPAFDFDEMLFSYRLPDVERRRFKVGVDNPGIVAVIA